MQLTHKQRTLKHPSNSDRALPLTNPHCVESSVFFLALKSEKNRKKRKNKKSDERRFQQRGPGRLTGMVVSMIVCALIALLEFVIIPFTRLISIRFLNLYNYEFSLKLLR